MLDVTLRRVGGDDRPDRGPVRARPVRLAAGPCARRRVPRGRDRLGVLRQRGDRLRRGVRPDRRLGFRSGVLRRLHRREEPVRRQPLRLRGDHVDVRGAPRAPAAGAHVRDPRRARHARDLHRAGRGADLGVLVHVPDLRAAALFTAIQLFRHRDEDPDIDDNALVRLTRRLIPSRGATTTVACSPGSTGAAWRRRCSSR